MIRTPPTTASNTRSRSKSAKRKKEENTPENPLEFDRPDDDIPPNDDNDESDDMGAEYEDESPESLSEQCQKAGESLQYKNPNQLQRTTAQRLISKLYSYYLAATRRADEAEAKLSVTAPMQAQLNEQGEQIKALTELITSTVIPAITGSAPTITKPKSTVTGPPTFAQVIKRPKTIARQHFPLIVEPKSAQQKDTNITHSDLTDLIDPEAEEIFVNRVSKRKEGKVVVSVSSAKDLDQLRDTLIANPDFNSKYTVREPRLRDPRMIISGVPKTNDDMDILERLFDSVPGVSDTYASYEDLKPDLRFIFHTKERNEQMNVVIQVPPKLRNILVKAGRIQIDWSCCRITDYILVTRCFNCCGLGHRSHKDKVRVCPNATVCSFCKGEHVFKDCPNKTDDTKQCCVNCTNANRAPGNKRFDVNHSAMSNDCPSLKAYKLSEFNRTRYV